ncbi:MAG: HDOD domain-containing protein, partial [Gammaproteobacteria bacterium]|nr:HDOD domain-containing protein [Gammaproteobacteria bacterium]
MHISPQLAQRLEKIKGLPSPPRVAMRIIDVANDPNTSLSQVADVITSDPVIAAKVMRMANSALYARPGGCNTLRQALVLLGLDATLIVALSFSLALGLRRDRQV